MRLRTHIIRLFFGTGLIKILTLIRELTTAYYLGTSFIKDGFVASFALAFLLFTPFTDILEKSTLPLYLKWKNAPQTAGLVLIQFAILGALVAAAAWLFRTPLLTHLFDGVGPASLLIAITQFQWMLGVAALFSAALFLAQILNAHHHYLWSESRNLVLSVGVMAALIFDWSIGSTPAIFVGYGIGMAGGIALLIGVAAKVQLIALPRRSDWQTLWPDTKHYWQKGSWIGVLALIGIVPGLLSQSILAAFGPAQLAAHDYATRLTSFFVAMTVPAVATPLFTKLAHLEKQNEFPLRLLIKIVAGFLLGFGVFFVGFHLWGRPVMNFILLRGAFDAQSMSLTFPFFYYYCAQFGLQAVMMVLNFVLMAYHKFGLFFWTNALRFAVFLAALLVGQSVVGPQIVPIAIAVSTAVMIGVQGVFLWRMIRQWGYTAV